MPFVVDLLPRPKVEAAVALGLAMDNRKARACLAANNADP